MKKILNYKYSIIIAAGILYLSLRNISQTEYNSLFIKIENIDKVIHGIMYFCLSLALALESKAKNNYRIILRVFLISTIFGGVMEILQLYVPSRTASWGDFLADMAGSALPLVILIIIYSTNYGRERESNANCPESDRRNRAGKS